AILDREPRASPPARQPAPNPPSPQFDPARSRPCPKPAHPQSQVDQPAAPPCSKSPRILMKTESRPRGLCKGPQRGRGSAPSTRRARASIPAGNPLEHDPEKWVPVFGKGLPPRKRGSCSTNKLERDDESKKSHHALGSAAVDQFTHLGCQGFWR